MKIQRERLEVIDRKISGQVTGGTQRHSLTVAVSRPWRGLKGSAAPGLPGQDKDNRSGNQCQMHKDLEKSICLLFSIKLSHTLYLDFHTIKLYSN